MVSPYRTQADLINGALEKLGVVSSGQPTDPEDYNNVAVEIDSILRELAGLEIVFVPDANNIPGAWFAALSSIVAGKCCEKFGSTVEYQQGLIAHGLGDPPGTGTAAKSLKQMQRGRPTGEVLRVEYF